MAAFKGWKVLNHGYTGLPKLSTKFTASEDGYIIYLTDLTHVWKESLSAAEISRRAEKDCCSINPADDTSQLRILLTKIESALHGGEGTSVHFESKNVADDLHIVVTAGLPKPLAPLVWHTQLQRSAPSELKTAIVVPLLRLAQEQYAESQRLLMELRNKDHVIDKLLDRMESANVHLDSVFLLPNMKYSKKVSQREQFASHVPGLAVFKTYSKLSEMDDPPSSEQLFEVLEKVDHNDTSVMPAKDGWWYDNVLLNQHCTSCNSTKSTDLDDSETDDGFQTQETPDRPQRQTPMDTHLSPANLDAESTDDDDIQPPPSQAWKAPPTSSHSHDSVATQSQSLLRRLGRIGKTPNPGERASQTEKSQSSMRFNVSPIPPESGATSNVASPVKRKLGTIGGQRGLSQPSILASHVASPPMYEQDSLLSMMNIDTLPQQPAPTSLRPDAGRSRLDKHDHGENGSSQLRETSEERANRKREELKSQLDAKAKAPVKKKRKF